jgi:MFS family permease
LICAAGLVRSAAVSLVGVTVAIYLARLGYTPTQIGIMIGVGLAGSSLATIAVAVRADAVGRRRALIGLTLLSAFGYIALALVTPAALLLPLVFVGMLNGMGRDRGAASALDQAILPATVSSQRRTWTLAWYNVVIDGGHAAGALGGAVPTLVTRVTGVAPASAHRITFLLCAAAMVASVFAYVALTPGIEVTSPSETARASLTPASKRVVTRLALLFGLDSIGGGFLNTALIAYWFFERYQMSEANLALLFFAARVLNMLSHLAAAWLAGRIGLLNTMVWTHLPSSLFLMAAPAAPSASLAAALFLAREALVEMDVPTRQSYLMAVVSPRERTFASGVTNVTRNVAWAVGPSVAGALMQYISQAGPLIVGGAFKIAYDLILYTAFRRMRPPEELAAPPRFADGRRHPTE